MFKNKVKRMFRMISNVAEGGYWHSITPPSELASITFSLKDIEEIKFSVQGHDLLPCTTVNELKELESLVPWYDRINFHKDSATIRLDDLPEESHKELSVYCVKKGHIKFFCLTK